MSKHTSELVDGYCRPIRHTHPALPAHLPTGDSRKSEEDKHKETDEEQEEGREDSELSEEEWSDLN